MEAKEYKFDGYAIGEQDFRSLRESNSVYVDKTHYLQKIADSHSKYYFMARPRRFGKSLFLSTLYYFFRGDRNLFQGLYIDSITRDWQPYPVLYLDLNAQGYEKQDIKGNIADTDKLDLLLEYVLDKWEKMYDVERTMNDPVSRFRKVIETAHEKTGRQVVILVDEYDKPLVHNLDNDDEFEYFRSKLSDLYANFKTCAEHIRLVFMTGVSRFSKLSVFSALNNLKDITFADEFADLCGITEEELLTYFQPGIKALSNKMGWTNEETIDELRRNYDGYRFSKAGKDVYNPWSVLNAMEFSEIEGYWDLTGFPTLIARSLKKLDINLEAYLNQRCDQKTLLGFDLLNADPLPLLYQTGYLTIKGYDPRSRLYTLGIPNQEVKEGLLKTLLPLYLRIKTPSPYSVVNEIVDSIFNGKPEKLMDALRVYFAGVPYDLKMENENNFQNALYILLSLIGVNVESEVHTSNGRIDLLIKTPDYIYIIELKYDAHAKAAITQIDEKRYDLPFRHDRRRIFKIGANFSPATRTIDSITIN